MSHLIALRCSGRRTWSDAPGPGGTSAFRPPIYRELTAWQERKGTPKPMADIMIAAICLVNACGLATRNSGLLRRRPGLAGRPVRGELSEVATMIGENRFSAMNSRGRGSTAATCHDRVHSRPSPPNAAGRPAPRAWQPDPRFPPPRWPAQPARVTDSTSSVSGVVTGPMLGAGREDLPASRRRVVVPERRMIGRGPGDSGPSTAAGHGWRAKAPSSPPPVAAARGGPGHRIEELVSDREVGRN